MAALVPLIVAALEAGLEVGLAAVAEAEGFMAGEVLSGVIEEEVLGGVIEEEVLGGVMEEEVLGEVIGEEEAAETAAAAAGEGIEAGAEVSVTECAEIAGPARVLLENLTAFTKWAAEQIIEFEAFDLGMRLFEQATTQKSKENAGNSHLYPLVNLMRLLNIALMKIDLVVKDWLDWAHQHQDNKKAFGQIQVEGTSLLRFEVLQYRLRDISDFRNKTLATKGKTASKSLDDETIVRYKDLRVAIWAYYVRVARMRTLIKANEAMVNAGLPANEDEIGIAKAVLLKASAIGK